MAAAGLLDGGLPVGVSPWHLSQPWWEFDLRGERITHHEFLAAICQAGLTEVAQVRVAILETNGRINVIAKDAEKT